MPRAGPRLRPIRPLPRSLSEKVPNFGPIFFFFLYKYFFKILKHFNLHFFFTIKKVQVMLEIEIRQI